MAIAIMSTMIITIPIIIANIDTQNMDTYSCASAGNNVVGYCEVDLDTAKTWCTYCNNNTNPPSGCNPTLGENINPISGGGVSSN